MSGAALWTAACDGDEKAVRNILTMGNCEGVLLCDELWS